MNDTLLKAAIDRFLKTVNASAQKELEKSLRKALAEGSLREGDTLTTSVTLVNDKIDLNVTIFSKIAL
jgi:hypothetical protein